MPSRPLIVRLRNWVGDVVLGVPTLRLLQGRGYALQLVGKPWAQSLLAGEGWPVHALVGGGLRQRVAQLRALRRQAQAQDADFDKRANTLVLPFSFSSALEARLAGLAAVGYAHEGRSLLLQRALPRPAGLHELQSYWQLGLQLSPPLPHGQSGRPDLALSDPPAPPVSIGLAIQPQAQAAAAQRLAVAGIGDGYVLLCPFAGGTFEGQDKRWPEFAAFARQAARTWGRPLLLCPGPGEAEAARADYPEAHVLEGVPLGDYAALLQRCALMVSNDTGPGHLAASVGAPLLSILGPTDVAQWGPWGPGVVVLQGQTGWPSVAQVLAAGERLLQQGPGAAHAVAA